MEVELSEKPWVTFCMSTFKRPAMLKSALETIAKQSFTKYSVIISDNDPDESARHIVKELNDRRFSYFSNGGNLGMIQSFNRSIERAETDFIVMITDDDPVTENFLEEIYSLYEKNPEHSIYCGFKRKYKKTNEVEVIAKEDFIAEILDISRTPVILWSSCVMKRAAVLHVGKMPDNGSPHLADHALIAMVGSIEGAVVINKMYSHITLHENNFSKFNFHYYTLGCKGFYEQMTSFCKTNRRYESEKKVIITHLRKWFITNIFNLKKVYTINRNDDILSQINNCARTVLAFPYMRQIIPRYYLKNTIFLLKSRLKLVK